MLALAALSEASTSSLPDSYALVFTAGGTVEGFLDYAARLRLVTEFGDRPIFAVEITLSRIDVEIPPTIIPPTDVFVLSSATFSGAGRLSVNATVVSPQVHFGFATFAGAGSFRASVLKPGLQPGQARFAGAGNFSISVLKPGIQAGTARFAGAGNLSINAAPVRQLHATYSGAGSLSVEARVYKTAAARFAGASNLSINADNDEFFVVQRDGQRVTQRDNQQVRNQRP